MQHVVDQLPLGAEPGEDVETDAVYEGEPAAGCVIHVRQLLVEVRPPRHRRVTQEGHHVGVISQ